MRNGEASRDALHARKSDIKLFNFIPAAAVIGAALVTSNPAEASLHRCFGYSGNVEECIRGAKALLNANGFNKSLEVDKRENGICNGLAERRFHGGRNWM